MKNLKNKILIILLFMIAILLIFNIESYATLSVRASKSSIAPGETFSVTVSVSSNEAGAISLSASNGTLSSSSIDLMSQSSMTISCTAGNSGSVSIYASGTVANYTTETEGSQSDSTTVTISVPSSSSGGGSSSSSSSSTTPTTKPVETKKSDDSKLKALSVAEGTITPEFSSEVKEYTLNVGNEITEVSVAATANNSKASYSVDGNKELQVGDNTVTVTVRAEDGTKSTYTILVTRARAELALQSLVASYTDENGVVTEIPLTPLFSFDVLEYKVDQVSYKIDKLNIEALGNLEGATVKVEGNENLQEGENKITITVTMPAELSETGEVIKEEETKTYTITVTKEADPIPPTTWQKIKNWFSGLFGGVSNWTGNNSNTIITGALAFCSVALLGLSVYLIVDYKKYRTLLSKVRQLTNLNSSEIVTEDISQRQGNISNIVEVDANGDNPQEEITSEKIIEENEVETKKKPGRHF